MSRFDDATAALTQLLHDLKAEPSKPIGLYEIRVPLDGRGFVQDEIVNALYELQRTGLIVLIEGNRLRVLKSY
jgi:hypothetical protein